MSFFFAVSLSEFRRRSCCQKISKISNLLQKNISNSGEWNDIFEEVQSDHFHCQGRSGFFGRVWTVGSSSWGVFGGISSPAWSLSVSWQPGAPSLPTHQSFLAITTWIWVLCTWIPSWNTQRPPEQLYPGAPDPLPAPSTWSSDGVNLPSHFQLEGVMG